MTKKFKVQYGNTILTKDFCKHCQEESLINVNNEFTCCGTIARGKTTGQTKLISSACNKKRTLTQNQQIKILKEQNYKCFHCEIDISSKSIHFDHLEPFSFSYNNHISNFVASCVKCNLKKSNLMN